MNIGEVAKMAELPIKTIRYYEEIGFIQPERSANGYRSFRVSDVHKLAFLGRARSLGFSIEDCRALLQLYENDTRASADVKQIAQETFGSHRCQGQRIAGYAQYTIGSDRRLRRR